MTNKAHSQKQANVLIRLAQLIASGSAQDG